MKLVKIMAVWVLVLLFAIANVAYAGEKLNFSPVFISLSDAMGAAKDGDTAKASENLVQAESEFDKITQDISRHSELFKDAKDALSAAKQSPTDETLKALSVKLYAYEKEQNPVDYGEKRQQFAKNIAKPLADLAKATANFSQGGDIESVRAAYDVFNRTWVSGERVVQNTSKAHYGTIETSIAMFRVGMENTPPNTAMMNDNLEKLKNTIASYNAGESLAEVKNDAVDLAYGIKLLEQGLDGFKAGDKATAQAKLSEFITSWVVFEGDVSTRNPTLYSQIESQIPVIMAKGDESSQAKLANLIDELKKINPTASYTAIDSMLILLREGLEALLVVVALITALNASGQKSGKKWIYGGVALGLIGSIAGAMALYRLFPVLAGGANREMLEGVVGIVAVVMMIGVGSWLHSKSSVKSWNHYIKNELGQAMTKGSFISLFLLAFLSVFREGAETILFYVGILPNIALGDFLMGIVMAMAVLAVVALILFKTSLKLPIPLLFKILTFTIYFLGFKILGVSISALQLTNHLPRTMVNLPSIEWAGFYPSVQGMTAQGIYVVVIVVIWLVGRKKH